MTFEDLQQIKESRNTNFMIGDYVYLVVDKTKTPLRIENINGMILTLTSYGDKSYNDFVKVSPPNIEYHYGRIRIHLSNVVKIS